MILTFSAIANILVSEYVMSWGNDEVSKFCARCGYEADDPNKFCPGCGAPLDGPGEESRSAPPTFLPPDRRITSSSTGGYSNGYSHYEEYRSTNPNVVTPDKLVVEPAVAVVLTFLLVGLGQMINGQVAKGLVILFCHIAFAVFTIGLSALPVFVLICMDAYKCAQALKEGRSIGKWSFFGSAK